MKKIVLSIIFFLFTTTLFAQDSIPEKPQTGNSMTGGSEIKDLQVQRDTAKAQLRAMTSQNTKDDNLLLKLHNEKGRLKDQLHTAKKSKKSDKIETIQTKITDNAQAIKDLELKLKQEDKELSKLEKELKNAEKELTTAKEKAKKEKAKGKK